jgi:hypothetical protein
LILSVCEYADIMKFECGKTEGSGIRCNCVFIIKWCNQLLFKAHLILFRTVSYFDLSANPGKLDCALGMTQNSVLKIVKDSNFKVRYFVYVTPCGLVYRYVYTNSGERNLNVTGGWRYSYNEDWHTFCHITINLANISFTIYAVIY